MSSWLVSLVLSVWRRFVRTFGRCWRQAPIIDPTAQVVPPNVQGGRAVVDAQPTIGVTSQLVDQKDKSDRHSVADKKAMTGVASPIVHVAASRGDAMVPMIDRASSANHDIQIDHRRSVTGEATVVEHNAAAKLPEAKLISDVEFERRMERYWKEICGQDVMRLGKERGLPYAKEYVAAFVPWCQGKKFSRRSRHCIHVVDFANRHFSPESGMALPIARNFLSELKKHADVKVFPNRHMYDESGRETGKGTFYLILRCRVAPPAPTFDALKMTANI